MAQKSIVRKNLILTIGFGITMGIVFPFYASFFVVFKSELMFSFFLTGCIIAGIMVGVIAFFITRNTVLKVAGFVSERLKSIAVEGVNIQELSELESNDVIGELVRSLNTVIRRLNKMMDIIKNNIGKTTAGSVRLNGIMKENSNSCNNIMHMITSINNIMKQQLEKSESTDIAIQVLNKSVLIVVTNILNLYAELDRLTSIMMDQAVVIDEINKEIEQVSGYINAKQTTDNSGSIKDLGENLITETNKIMRVFKSDLEKLSQNITLIEDLSSRTNLLAINTSIEAVHAEKQGKGFSIIAGEIRQLSENTSLVTKAIKDSISSITGGINGSMEMVDETKIKFHAAIKATDESISSLAQLSLRIKSMTDNITNEYQSIEQILTDVKEKIEFLKEHSTSVQNFMKDLKSVIVTVNTDMESICKGGDSISTAITDSLDISNEVAKSMRSIETEIQSKDNQNKQMRGKLNADR